MLKDKALSAGTQSAGDGACSAPVAPQGLAPVQPTRTGPTAPRRGAGPPGSAGCLGAASPLAVTYGFPAVFYLVLLCFLNFSLTYTILSHELIKTSNIA